MAAYYNEIEPYAVDWLRNLIRAGLIPAGDVDERSIVNVYANDIKGYTQCHFFAGVGGWPLALRHAGWPDGAEVWTGSCPCQPLSVAGQRRGHADERHVWPAFYGLITECRPAIVFGEQVASKDGVEWLSAVRADLEAARYAVGAADLCATAFGSQQERERLFFFANAAGADTAGRHPAIRRLGRQSEMAAHWRNADWRESCEIRVLDDALPGRVAKAITRGFGNAIDPEVGAEFVMAANEAILTENP